MAEDEEPGDYMAEDEEPGDYLEQRKDIHDCFFVVGTEKKERISTVSYLLANYSPYFRAMLLETDMKEKNSKEDIVIPDHEPDVFRLMISFVYGRHDIKFKDIDQAIRFYILVDQCLMPKLKKLSSEYLKDNCTSNLFEVLEPRAKMMVEKHTGALLSSPDFLNLNPAIIEFIVKQDGLNVTEVQLWRALVKWAKHQCDNTNKGIVLRKKMDSVIKHMKFLKMTLKEFAEDVVPTSILTPSLTTAVFFAMVKVKGNTIKEPPSKTRREWLSPQPIKRDLSIEGDQNISYDDVSIDGENINCDDFTIEGGVPIDYGLQEGVYCYKITNIIVKSKLSLSAIRVRVYVK